MRILGIDPGTRVVGYGVIDQEGSRLHCVDAGALSVPAGLSIERRLAMIAADLREVIETHRPTTSAMEDVFVATDPRAALKIGFGRGAILAVLGEAQLEVASYPPATIKKAVAGNGRANKEQVAHMVAAILGLGRAPEPLDATDALAVAITHSLRASKP
ncbi:MAG: crossover junction endodeoxyribonuclease RuvC [Planctomycetota bacterium]